MAQIAFDRFHVKQSLPQRGMLQFFIRHDLKRLDFSRVLYNWDCC